MAKSTRSKVKRSFRSKKREDSVYAATAAARVHRLSAKLRAIASIEEGNAMDEDEEDRDRSLEGIEVQTNGVPEDTGLGATGTSKTERISTHGPRNSRREQWRESKGMKPLPPRRGMNRQGGVAARRKSGRASRRR